MGTVTTLPRGRPLTAALTGEAEKPARTHPTGTPPAMS